MVNLKNFQSASVLKEAIKTFIIMQYLSAHDIKDLKDVFISLDKDHDGKISYEELMNEYKKIMDENDAEILVTKVIKQVDLDKNGFVDYSEFLKANFDTRELMSEKNLKATFEMFDADGSGKISAEEMKRLIEGENTIDIDCWNEVIKEFDVNGDGEIDINEFTLFLKTITQNNL